MNLKGSSNSIIGKLSSLINYTDLKSLKINLIKLYNCYLLGLDKPVIKSHGSTDTVSFANSLRFVNKLLRKIDIK